MMIKSDVVNFRVSSALKNLIGKELITNNYVAVFELVKNSFDAKSTEIIVTIDLFENKITVKDNGAGMSLDDVKNKWLFIGYSEKKDSNDIAYSGNKGIGRFSCDRLGSTLKLQSINEGIKTSLNLDWRKYEEDQTKDIQALPVELSSETTDESHGTILEIGNLRAAWSDKDVKKTKDQLMRLVSPNKREIKQKLSLIFINKIGILETFEDLYNDVFEYMESKAVCVKSFFTSEIIKTELFDCGRKILSTISENKSLIKEAKIQLFFADRKAKAAFKRKTGVDLINYGNLFIYRNTFRVYPFGETSFDPFGLADRKTQGHSRFLGPREISGWIDIVDRENHFIESTSRDRGFIENVYSNSLKDVYMEYIHKPLEKYVEIMNYGNIEIEDILSDSDSSIMFDSIKRSFQLKNTIQLDLDEKYIFDKTSEGSLNQLEDESISSIKRKQIIKEVQYRLKNQETELGLKREQLKRKKEENERLQEELKAKNRFLDNKNPSRQNVLEHDLGLVVKKMIFLMEDLHSLNRDIRNPKIDKAIHDLSWAIYRTKGIRNFILKTNMDTKTNKQIEVGEFLKEYSTIIDYERVNVNVHIEQEFIIKINVFDLITIFDNILSNVDNLNGKKLDIYINQNTIQFVSDTFDSVRDQIDFSKVFDYGYTTNENGTGIGMYFVRQICKQLKLDIEIRQMDNTDFVITEIKRYAQNN